MSETRPVISLRDGTAFRRAFGDMAAFSEFASDALGEMVRVTSVRTELRGRGRLTWPLAHAGLGGDDDARALRVEFWLLGETGYRERAARAHATAWADRAAKASGGPAMRVATIAVVVPRARRAQQDGRAARYDDGESAPAWECAVDHGDRLVFVRPWVDEAEAPPRLRRWFSLFVASDAGRVASELARDETTRRVIDAIDRRTMSLHELEAVLDASLWEEHLARTYRAARRRGYREGLMSNVLEAMTESGHLVDDRVRAWAAGATVDELRRVIDALRGGGGGSG